MSENIFDLTFLLGFSYMQLITGVSKDDLLNKINERNSFFIKKLPSIIHSLLAVKPNIGNICKILKLSKNQAFLLNPATTGGRCNICDKYYFNIRKHLVHVHCLNWELASMHSTLFSDTCYYNMPAEFKNLDDFPDLAAKSMPKIKSYSQLKIKNKPVPKKNILSPGSFVGYQDKPGCMICGDCGKIVTSKNRASHVRSHQKNEIVECPICDIKCKKKYLYKHSKTCGTQPINP